MRPCLMDYRIQWHWQAARTHSDLSPASPCGGEGRHLLGSWSKIEVTASPLTSSQEPHHSPLHSLPLAPWLHPAHFNFIFLTHVPHPSRDESVWLLPCLMLVLKVRTFPKDRKQTKGKKDHKTIRIQSKHKHFEYSICPRMNTWFPLYTWQDPLLFQLSSWKEAGGLAWYRKSQEIKDLWEVQSTQRARALFHFNRP